MADQSANDWADSIRKMLDLASMYDSQARIFKRDAFGLTIDQMRERGERLYRLADRALVSGLNLSESAKIPGEESA